MGGLHREIRLGVSRRVLLRSITAFSALVLVVSCKPVQCVRMCCLSEACPKILTQRVGVRAEFRGALSCPCKPFKKRSPPVQKKPYTKTITQHFNASHFSQNAAKSIDFKCVLMPCHGSLHFNTVLQNLWDLINPTVDRGLLHCSPTFLRKLLNYTILPTGPSTNVLFG